MLRSLLDFLAPPRCAGCLRAGPVWCEACLCALDELRLPGLGWEQLGDGILAIGAYRYEGPVALGIKRAKTPGSHALAPGLAAILWAAVRLDPREAPRTWVPSAPERARARAVELPEALAGPGAVRLLARQPHAPKQTTLAPAERRRAPHGTFRVIAPPPPAVILVDDVRTTGATALAAAGALRAAGAQRVLVLTLAVAGWGPARADDRTAPRTARSR